MIRGNTDRRHLRRQRGRCSTTSPPSASATTTSSKLLEDRGRAEVRGLLRATARERAGHSSTRADGLEQGERRERTASVGEPMTEPSPAAAETIPVDRRRRPAARVADRAAQSAARSRRPAAAASPGSRARSSSSASPATWPARSCCRRSTTWPTAVCCRPTSYCSASPAATGATATSSSWPRRRRRQYARTDWNEDVWKRLCGQHQVRARVLRRRRGVRHAGQDARRAVRSARHQGQRRVLPVDPAVSMFPVVLKQMERTGMAEQRTQRRLAAGRGREAVRPRPAQRARSSTSSSTRCSPRRTSSASTTTWARRPSRTSWRCGSPTSCSSRSGTPTYVDSVQITMAEDVGIGGRAAFYDATGAARDVLQNHLLQLLALTAMEEPVEFSAEAIRTEKLKVLRAISLPDDLGAYAVRGQYDQGWLAGERAAGLPRREGHPRRLEHRDLRRGAARRRDAALGRRAVLPAHRQAAAPAGHRDRACCSRRRRTCRSAAPTPRSSATTSSSSGCSPTRASR